MLVGISMDNHTINVLYILASFFVLFTGIYYTEYEEEAILSQPKLAGIVTVVAAISAAVVYIFS